MSEKIDLTMTPGEWALLIALSAIWGGSFFFVEVAVKELPPLSIVAARVGGASILLYAALRLTGKRLPTGWTPWLAFAMMGILNNVIPFSLIAWGQVHIASGLASILNATAPLFTVLVAHYATSDERMTPARITGVVIGFLGVVVMIGIDVLADVSGDLLAQLAVLVASLGYAMSSVYARRFKTLGIRPLNAAAGQMISAAAIMIPLALVFDQPWTNAMPSPGVLGSLFGLAFLSTFVAYIIYYRIVATAGSVNLMLVTFLVPVSAIILGTSLLGERLAFNHVVGMAAIGLGLAVLDGRPMAMLKLRLTRNRA